MSRVVVAFDPSWGGTGWSVIRGKISAAGAFPNLTSRRWRWLDMTAELDRLEAEVLPSIVQPGDVVRVALEIPQIHYTRRGNQTRQVRPMVEASTLVGRWGLRKGWAYPWLLEPREWRKLAKVGGRNRAEKKLHAVAIARFFGAGHFLDGLSTVDASGDGAQGDVAEAIVLGLTAYRCWDMGPKGPRGWTR